MAVKIRTAPYGREEGPVLPRGGSGFPFPRDGRFIEEIGYYDPTKDPAVVKIDSDKAKAWIANGAQPTDTVRVLLKKEQHSVRL